MALGLMLSLIGMHNIDIAYNMKLVNLYSEGVLIIETCVIEYPSVWKYDSLPNDYSMNSRQLYMFGISLLGTGIILLVISTLMT